MKKFILACLLPCILGTSAYGQLSLGAQLRPRAEFRNGQGSPQSKDADPAFFISQRTRLWAMYANKTLQFKINLQDARVWGQDVSSINRTTTANNNGLLLHEAWAAVNLLDTASIQHLSLKIGRQELQYDDSRLLGNLDWLQQSRRHDAIVLKYSGLKWQIDLGAAYNQNKENSSGTIYNAQPPGNYGGNTNGGTQYKSMEYLHIQRSLQAGRLSFLLLADQFSPFDIDSVNKEPVKVWKTGSYARYTGGIYYQQTSGSWHWQTAAYYQFGKSPAGQNLDAFLWNIAAGYQLDKNLDLGTGADYSSADFDPLYGTAHKFYGAMDYYYAASSEGNHGVQDYHIDVHWQPLKGWKLNSQLHQFFAAENIDGYQKNYGTELDINAAKSLYKFITLELGYSHYWSTRNLVSPAVKNIPNASLNSNWAYLSININPSFIIKSI